MRSSSHVTAKRDCWAEWVARMRPSQQSDDVDHPHWRWRDRVLAAAEPIAGETVLDVGCGEGLVAFGALDRGAREVVFSDISDDLLEYCRAAARERGVIDRCCFVRASSDKLTPLEAASVDVVATRSVLINVDDKESAFREFARVLRPGGRLSIFEPINRFAYRDIDSWMGYDLASVSGLAGKVRSVYEAIQPPGTDPMLNFDERDLLALAERAGSFPSSFNSRRRSGPASRRAGKPSWIRRAIRGYRRSRRRWTGRSRRKRPSHSPPTCARSSRRGAARGAWRRHTSAP